MKHLILIATLSLSLFAQVAAPSLTELEATQRALLLTRAQNLALQQAQLDRDVQDFVKAVQSAHPGYQLTNDGKLVEIPKEPKEKAK